MDPDQTRFKALLVRDKEWLQELYQSESLPNRKRLLVNASDKKIDTLIKFIHLLSNGVIKMHKKNFDEISKQSISYLRKTFEKKTALRQILSSERHLKLKKLQKLIQILPLLLYTLFNE